MFALDYGFAAFLGEHKICAASGAWSRCYPKLNNNDERDGKLFDISGVPRESLLSHTHTHVALCDYLVTLVFSIFKKFKKQQMSTSYQ